MNYAVAATCEDPGVNANSLRIQEGISDGTVVNYVCDNGFTMRGASAMTCLDGR